MLGSDIVKYFLRRVADGDVNIVSGRFCSVEKRITRLEPREGGGAYLDVEEQRSSKRRWHGHDLFGGQAVEVYDDYCAADLRLFLDQRSDLDQIEYFEQLFAGQVFRVPSR